MKQTIAEVTASMIHLYSDEALILSAPHSPVGRWAVAHTCFELVTDHATEDDVLVVDKGAIGQQIEALCRHMPTIAIPSKEPK